MWKWTRQLCKACVHSGPSAYPPASAPNSCNIRCDFAIYWLCYRAGGLNGGPCHCRILHTYMTSLTFGLYFVMSAFAAIAAHGWNIIGADLVNPTRALSACIIHNCNSANDCMHHQQVVEALTLLIPSLVLLYCNGWHLPRPEAATMLFSL